MDNSNEKKKTLHTRLPVFLLFFVLAAFVFCFFVWKNIKEKGTVYDSAGKKTEAGFENCFESFSAVDLEGKEYTEELFSGHKLTMINIWATFCVPCIKEMPVLQGISEEYEETELQILGLVGDLYIAGELSAAQLETAEKTAGTVGCGYPNLVPSPGMIQDLYGAGLQFYPTTLFFNDRGELLQVVAGARSEEEWKRIIGEAGAGK